MSALVEAVERLADLPGWRFSAERVSDGTELRAFNPHKSGYHVVIRLRPNPQHVEHEITAWLGQIRSVWAFYQREGRWPEGEEL